MTFKFEKVGRKSTYLMDLRPTDEAIYLRKDINKIRKYGEDLTANVKTCVAFTQTFKPRIQNDFEVEDMTRIFTYAIYTFPEIQSIMFDFIKEYDDNYNFHWHGIVVARTISILKSLKCHLSRLGYNCIKPVRDLQKWQQYMNKREHDEHDLDDQCVSDYIGHIQRSATPMPCRHEFSEH